VRKRKSGSEEEREKIENKKISREEREGARSKRKHEARNSKQISNTKVQNSKQKTKAGPRITRIFTNKNTCPRMGDYTDLRRLFSFAAQCPSVKNLYRLVSYSPLTACILFSSLSVRQPGAGELRKWPVK